MNQSEKRSNRRLLSYAYAAQAGRGAGDLLSGIVPLFRPIAKENAGKSFLPKKFAKQLDLMYGIKVGEKAIEDITTRLEKEGIIQDSGRHEAANGKIVVTYNYCDIDIEFENFCEQDLNEILDAYVKYAKGKLSDHEVQRGDEELRDGFLQALSKIGTMGYVLRPQNRRGMSSTEVKPELGLKDEALDELLSASFVVESYHNNRDIYDLCSKVARGALVAEVILDVRQPDVNINLSATRFILDTPVLMNFLNLSGESEHKAAAELVEAIRVNGGQVYVLDHSVRELVEILKRDVTNFERGEFIDSRNATQRRLQQKSFYHMCVQVKSNPKQRLRVAGIQIQKSPTNKACYQYFSEQDRVNLHDSLGSYHNPYAQEHDAECIASIMRLRAGKCFEHAHFHRSQYLFITYNNHLAYQAKRYVEEKKMCEEESFSPAVTDRYLASLLWVVFGGETDSLSNELLLANCAAAMEVDSDVLRKVYSFIGGLNEEEANFYRALMNEERAGQHVMSMTLGDAEFITDDNFPELLKQIRDSANDKLRADFETKLRNEKARNREALERVSGEASQRIAEICHEYDSKIENAKEEYDRKINKEHRHSQQQILDLDGKLIAEKNENRRIRMVVEELQMANKIREEKELQKEKKHVEDCLEQATRAAHVLVMVLVVLIAVLSTLLAVGVISPKTWSVYSVALIYFPIALVGLWKFQDWVLGGVYRFAAKYRYRKAIENAGVKEAELHWYVDWKREAVLPVDIEFNGESGGLLDGEKTSGSA